MTMSKKSYIESLPRELLIDIVERIASYSLKDLMRVKLSSRVLNQVANEPSVYQKVTLVSIPYRRWSIVQQAISFLEMCRALGNLEALYRKGVFDFFNLKDPTVLGMISQAADDGHIGASHVLAIISIFNGGESMREGLMFIANMKKTEPLKVKRCRHNLRNILSGMWMLEPHLLGGRPICCTIHQFEQIRLMNGWPMGSDNEDDIRCDLCSCDLKLDYAIKFLPYTTVWY
uniref:F-box domain-containing protein n=1 Tax=Solanum tuberosum TaxID=4113 RepID=M1DTV0_SOLTU